MGGCKGGIASVKAEPTCAWSDAGQERNDVSLTAQRSRRHKTEKQGDCDAGGQVEAGSISLIDLVIVIPKGFPKHLPVRMEAHNALCQSLEQAKVPVTVVFNVIFHLI